MANVIGGAHSSQVTGSIEGIVYSPDSSGTNVRARVTPNKNYSTTSHVYRNRVFQNCSFQFQNLSVASLDFWINWADTHQWRNKLGQNCILTARQWYLKYCLARQLYFFSTSDTLPDFTTDKFLPNFSLEWTASGASLSWDQTLPVDWAIAVWTDRNLRSTQVRHKSWVLTWSFQSPTISPQLITGEIDEENVPPGFAGILDNSWLNVRIKTVNIYGWSSPFQTFRINPT